jgi:hypothetical protein
MPPRGSVKWEIGELPQMAHRTTGKIEVSLCSSVPLRFRTLVGGGEVEVGEQNLVGPQASKIQPGYAAVSGTRDVRRRSSSIRCRT